MLSFESDYTEGAHARILERLLETNYEQLPGYGKDKYCDSAKEKIKNAIGHNDSLLLSSGDVQYFIPIKEIIFCESLDGHTVCHTKDKVLSSPYKLFELEKILSPTFCRASKSMLINCREVYSVRKNLAGPSEIAFRSTPKKAYLSRSYYKMFMERMNETRL